MRNRMRNLSHDYVAVQTKHSCTSSWWKILMLACVRKMFLRLGDRNSISSCIWSTAIGIESGVVLLSLFFLQWKSPSLYWILQEHRSHFDHHNNDLLFSPPGFCLLDLTEQFALPETSPPMLARILEAIEKKGELWPRELQVTHLDMKLEFQLFLLTLTVC